MLPFIPSKVHLRNNFCVTVSQSNHVRRTRCIELYPSWLTRCDCSNMPDAKMLMTFAHDVCFYILSLCLLYFPELEYVLGPYHASKWRIFIISQVGLAAFSPYFIQSPSPLLRDTLTVSFVKNSVLVILFLCRWHAIQVVRDSTFTSKVRSFALPYSPSSQEYCPDYFPEFSLSNANFSIIMYSILS